MLSRRMWWKDTLGYAEGNSRAALHKKYARLALRHHPDKLRQMGRAPTAANEARIRQLTLAWAAAQEYMRGAASRSPSPPSTPRAPAGFDSEPQPMDWEPTPPPSSRHQPAYQQPAYQQYYAAPAARSTYPAFKKGLTAQRFAGFGPKGGGVAKVQSGPRSVPLGGRRSGLDPVPARSALRKRR